MTDQPQSDQGRDDAAAAGCVIEKKQTGEVCVVSVTGTLDMLTAPALETAIASAAGEAATVVVDLTAVDFLASAGMGVLVAAHAEWAPAIRIVVVADGPTTSRPLTLVGVTELIQLFATLDEALAAVSP